MNVATQKETVPRKNKNIPEEANLYFRAKGFERATMRGLAKHLKMSVSNLYYHYPDKKSLLAAGLEFDIARLLDQVVKGTSKKGMSTEDKFHAYFDCHIDFQLEIMKVISSQTPFLSSRYLIDNVEPLAAKRIRGMLGDSVNILKNILIEGQKSKVFDFQDLTVTTFAILSLTEHLPNWYKPKGRLSTKELAKQLKIAGMRIVTAP